MSTLYEQTLELLINSDMTIQDIATQADLPYDWLVSIRYDRVKNPSVNRVQKLYEFLSGKPLTV